MSAVSVARDQRARGEVDLEPAIREYGERIFSLIDEVEPPSIFSRKGLQGALMEWAMRDAHFKTQLFRFVDVLPTLSSSAEVARHLREYLGDEHLHLSPALRTGLKAAGRVPWLFGGGIKSQVTGMARQFMLGNDEKEIIAALRKLHEQGVAFTVDILGETVVSEEEADHYARRYLGLMDLLAPQIAGWGNPCPGNQSPRGPLPALARIGESLGALFANPSRRPPDTALEKGCRALASDSAPRQRTGRVH